MDIVLKFALIFKILSPIESRFGNISNFINKLEISEKINLNYIIENGNPEFTNDILKSLLIPAITMKSDFYMNFLNFPRFEFTKSPKYYFNREFLVITVSEFCIESLMNISSFRELLEYSRNNILIIIVEKTCYNVEHILKDLYTYDFTNVVYIDMNDFQKSLKFETFEVFPSFRYVSRFSFKKENILNVKGRKLNAFCNYQFPFSHCLPGNISTVGRIFHVIRNFKNFINGRLFVSYKK